MFIFNEIFVLFVIFLIDPFEAADYGNQRLKI